MRNEAVLGVAVSVFVLTGCTCFHRQAPRPSAITLEDAMVSVSSGLVRMAETAGNYRFGLMPSEVDVTFNLTASATDSSKLVVDMSAPPLYGVTAKASGEKDASSSFTRGNQVVVKFQNLFFADPKSTLVGVVGSSSVKTIPDLYQVIQSTNPFTNTRPAHPGPAAVY